MHRLLEAMGWELQADKRFYRTLFTRSILSFGNMRVERVLPIRTGVCPLVPASLR